MRFVNPYNLVWAVPLGLVFGLLKCFWVLGIRDTVKNLVWSVTRK